MSRPNLSYLRNLTLAVSGGFCGAWSGLTGMSAALPSAPMLGWLIGLREPRLNAAAIIITVAASLTALIAFGQHRFIDPLLALIFAIASTIGALIGAAPFFADIRDSRTAQRIWCVTLALLPIAMFALVKTFAHFPGSTLYNARPSDWISLDIEAGLAAGFYGRLSSTGAACVVPALIVIGHLSVVQAIACALSVYVIVSIIPAWAYISKGAVENVDIVWPTVGAAIGALIGSRQAISDSPSILVIAYAIGLAVLVVLAFFKKDPPPSIDLVTPDS